MSSALDEDSAPVKALTNRISMLILIIRWRGACFGSFASLIFAEISAPTSTLITVISLISALVHRRCAICGAASTRSWAATAVGLHVGKVHWLCHLDLGLLVVKIHWLCHLDLGLLAVKVHWLCHLD